MYSVQRSPRTAYTALHTTTDMQCRGTGGGGNTWRATHLPQGVIFVDIDDTLQEARSMLGWLQPLNMQRRQRSVQ